MNISDTKYKIIRSTRRKRVGVRAQDANHFEIFVPEHISDEAVVKIIIANREHILRLLEKASHKKITIDYQDGVTVLLQGKELTLRYIDMEYLWDLNFEESTLYIANEYRTMSEAVLKNFYEQQFFKLKDMCQELATRYKFPLNKVYVRWTKSKWGSCSSLKNVSLSAYLLMAPLQVQEYIIFHELCHLMHPDHSPAFYDLLESYCPDWKEHKLWLKENGWRLRILPHSEV